MARPVEWLPPRRKEVEQVKRDWARLIAIIGALLVVQSVVWEYVRMKPTNNYLVDPWAYRGFESIHGAVFAVVGIALLATILVVSLKASQEPRNSLTIVGLIVVAGYVIALIFASGERTTISLEAPILAVISLILGSAIYLALRRVLDLSARFVGPAARFGSIVGLFLILQLIVGGKDVEMAASTAVLLTLLMIAALVVAIQLPGLAANRMLMAATVVAGTAIGMSGAAIRSTLVRLQGEGELLNGQYRDTQVTWGYFLANIGIVVVFIGAVMLWARRRDLIQSQQRAAKQREAAEESARELAAAS